MARMDGRRAGQRYNPLEETWEGEGSLYARAPARPDLCPPGHYMLFTLRPDGRGGLIPSVAKVARVG